MELCLWIQVSAGILEGRAKFSWTPESSLNLAAWVKQTLFAVISSSLLPCSGSTAMRPQVLPSLGKSEAALGAGVVWNGIIIPLQRLSVEKGTKSVFSSLLLASKIKAPSCSPMAKSAEAFLFV